MAGDLVLLVVEAGVAEITLNRPDKLNSFTAALHRELAATLDRVAADDAVRAVLLTGAGRGFCAGQDLADPEVMGDAAPPIGETIGTYYNPLVERLVNLPKPVVCAVNGVAAGAGANLALACDIVLAARSAAFIQAFAKIGLVPDTGGTFFLPRILGTARAMALALLGDKLPAEQAQAWGLIWRVVDDAALMDEARGLARQLATQPTRSLGLIKRAIHAAAGHDLSAQLDLERALQDEAAATEDHREGVRAFIERRVPAFTGR